MTADMKGVAEKLGWVFPGKFVVAPGFSRERYIQMISRIRVHEVRYFNQQLSMFGVGFKMVPFLMGPSTKGHT